MKKMKFNEGQIISILKEGEAGIPVAEIGRKHGISVATFYSWRSKYGNMTQSELKRLKQLESELCRLKRMYAEVSMDNRILKDVIEKKL